MSATPPIGKNEYGQTEDELSRAQAWLEMARACDRKHGLPFSPCRECDEEWRRPMLPWTAP